MTLRGGIRISTVEAVEAAMERREERLEKTQRLVMRPKPHIPQPKPTTALLSLKKLYSLIDMPARGITQGDLLTAMKKTIQD